MCQDLRRTLGLKSGLPLGGSYDNLSYSLNKRGGVKKGITFLGEFYSEALWGLLRGMLGVQTIAHLGALQMQRVQGFRTSVSEGPLFACLSCCVFPWFLAGSCVSRGGAGNVGANCFAQQVFLLEE